MRPPGCEPNQAMLSHRGGPCVKHHRSMTVCGGIAKTLSGSNSTELAKARRLLFAREACSCLGRARWIHSRAAALLRVLRPRRGGRVVECTALEMRHTGNRIGGSNPSLSANSSSNYLILLGYLSCFITCAQPDAQTIAASRRTLLDEEQVH